MVNVIIALAVTRWVIFARVVRGSAIAVRDREFVDSARVMGASHGRIMLHYILPSCLPPLLVAATVQVGLTMVAEASLSFLGLGVPAVPGVLGIDDRRGPRLPRLGLVDRRRARRGPGAGGGRASASSVTCFATLPIR